MSSIYIYVKFRTLLAAPYIYDISRLRAKSSICFGNHLPIFRRYYTNAVLVSVVFGYRCGLFLGVGEAGTVFSHPENSPYQQTHTTLTKTAFV
jgi:hypothetical protein